MDMDKSEDYKCVSCGDNYLVFDDDVKDQLMCEDDKTIICLDCQRKVYDFALEAIR